MDKGRSSAEGLTRVECLTVYLGGVRISVPVDAVDTIGDYRLTPAPPLSQDWIVGLGRHAHQAFVVIDPLGMRAKRSSKKQGTTKCLVMTGQEGTALWGLRVDRLGDIEVLSVDPTTRMALPDWAAPKSWAALAQSKDGEEMPFLNLGLIHREFELASSPNTQQEAWGSLSSSPSR